VNPFNEQLLEEFRGERVRVRSPAFDAPVRGYLRVPHFDDGAVLLHGATRLPTDDGDRGEHLGTVLVRRVDAIAAVGRADDGRGAIVQEVAPGALVPNRYAARTYDDTDLEAFARDVTANEAPFSFPKAYLSDRGVELLGGHKRTRAAVRAGLDAIPVRLYDVDDFAALRHFAADHVPVDEGEAGEERRGRGYYDRAELRRSLAAMLEDWSAERLREVPGLDHWLDELGWDVSGFELVDPHTDWLDVSPGPVSDDEASDEDVRRAVPDGGRPTAPDGGRRTVPDTRDERDREPALDTDDRWVVDPTDLILLSAAFTTLAASGVLFDAVVPDWGAPVASTVAIVLLGVAVLLHQGRLDVPGGDAA
jgi:hypothetical protein